MKREINLVTLFYHAKRKWRIIAIVILITTFLGVAFGLMKATTVSAEHPIKQEDLDETSSTEELAIEKENILQNIALFLSRVDQIEDYFNNSILVGYNPMSLPSTTIKANLDVEDDEQELLISAKYSNSYREEEYYRGMNQILGGSFDYQYLDELTSVNYDSLNKQLSFTIYYDDFIKGEELANHLYEYGLKRIQHETSNKEELQHKLIHIDTFSSRAPNPSLLQSVNQLVRERDAYRSHAQSEQKRLEEIEQLPTFEQNQGNLSSGRRSINLIKYGVMGTFIGLFIVLTWLFLYSLSETSLVLPLELKEVYGFDNIFEIKEGDGKGTSYLQINPGELNGYLTSLKRNTHINKILVLGNIDLSIIQNYLPEEGLDYISYGSSNFLSTKEMLGKADRVILLEDLNKLSHRVLNEQLQLIKSSGKTVDSLLFM